MLKLANVGKRYASGQRALHNITFTIDKSEFVFLTGHSGAGKSTLLNIIAGLEQPSYGHVNFANISYNQLNPKVTWIIRRNIGIVSQTPMLLSDKSVFHNVALPLIVQNNSANEIHKRVRAALDKVGLNTKLNSIASTLSGGEQQRVAVARAIVNKPKLIIADEPTGNLDSKLSLDILQLFIDFNKVGVAILLATHDMQLLKNFPSKTLTIANGILAKSEANT